MNLQEVHEVCTFRVNLAFEMIQKLKISDNMYIDKEIFSRMTSDRGYNMLLILEYLSDSRTPKTLNEILSHLQSNPMRRASVAPKGRGVRIQLGEMVEEDLLACNDSQRSRTWEVTGRLRELENIPVRQKDIPHLLNWKMIFEKYRFLPFFRDIEAFIGLQHRQIEEQLDGQSSEQAYRIADFDTRGQFSGQEIVEPLYLAIEDCDTISIEYHSFGKTKPKDYLHLKPYLLKEHNHRWYLIAVFDNESGYRVFPLDRIVSILENEDESIFARDSFDPDKLWEHSMGIDLGWTDSSTGEYRTNPIEITLEVKDGVELKNIAYLETSPIHHSQTLKKAKSGYAKVTLMTFPVADAVRAVRALGVHNLKNIKPDYFAKWVLEE